LSFNIVNVFIRICKSKLYAHCISENILSVEQYRKVSLTTKNSLFFTLLLLVWVPWETLK
jgi:hypothetical protein